MIITPHPLSLNLVISQCRETVVQLETITLILEMDFPRCLAMLDDKICMIRFRS